MPRRTHRSARPRASSSRAARRRRPFAVLIGTRPEAIKLMPVVRQLEAAGRPPEIYVTGQHGELLEPVLRDLALVPTVNLALLTPGQTLGRLSGRVVEGVQRLLRKRRPSLLIVQGDTTSVAMSALAAFYEDVPVAHVEAGLRSGMPRNPFPEDMNRRLVACLASLHFAPTKAARDNLRKEGVPAERIHLVGNTVVDALLHARQRVAHDASADESFAKRPGEKLVLVTAHRRESFGKDLAELFRGLRRVATHRGARTRIVFPVHLNPNVRKAARALLGGVPNVALAPPLPYLRFVRLLETADVVVTDSGGVLEEATALGIPTLIVRRTTERNEAIDAGVAELVPPDAQQVFRRVSVLLDDASAHRARARASSVFGDGRAAERIVRVLQDAKL